MKIRLENLNILNFKGATEQQMKFTDQNEITGDNRAGKTRTFDSVLWLLFGKDSQGKTDFDIKPLDHNNQPKEKAEVEVEANFEVEGKELQLMKIFREKWQKKRGATEATFTGHETIHYVNNLITPKAQYEEVISKHINQNMFRLVTSPVYFENLPWMEKRQMLFKITKQITDRDIAKGNTQFESLLDSLDNKSIEDYKKSIQATKRKIEDELKLIPSRIDEQERSKPEAADYKEIEKSIQELERNIKAIDDSIVDKSKAFETAYEAIKVKKSELFQLESEQINMENKHVLAFNTDKNSVGSEIEVIQLDISHLNQRMLKIHTLISSTRVDIEQKEAELSKLRSSFDLEDKKTFKLNEDALNCPTCKQLLLNAEEKREELEGNFNRSKQLILGSINKEGVQLLAIIDENTEQLKKHKTELSNLEASIKEKEVLIKAKKNQVKDPESIESRLKNDPEYQELLIKIEAKKKEIPNTVELNVDDLKEKRSELVNQLSEKNHSLFGKDKLNECNERIKQLNNNMKTLAQQIADYEKIQFTIEEFTKKKISLIENEINSKFSYVKFKLYNKLINGGEEETCITLIDGVPYASANYASKINAGLDIINTFSKHYDIYAPVFIDNCESITTPLEMHSQVIKLIKVSGQKELLITNK